MAAAGVGGDGLPPCHLLTSDHLLLPMVERMDKRLGRLEVLVDRVLGHLVVSPAVATQRLQMEECRVRMDLERGWSVWFADWRSRERLA